MAVRHRIPSIFNLSMVDVLCCALGCVILLWLLNLREARNRAEQAGKTSEQLQSAESALTESASRLRSATSERDELLQNLKAERLRLERLNRDLAGLRTDRDTTQERLAKLSREHEATIKERADLSERLLALDSRLQDKDKKAKVATQRIELLSDTLKDTEARLRILQAMADLVPGLRADLQKSRSQLAAAETRAQNLQQDLEAAKGNIGSLEQEKKSLTDLAKRARAAYENRFEGIALTGRRVMFLVDMSGSMDLVDERTPDLNKWSGVRNTVVKIMRSLPDLEKFQVLVFAEKVSYLLGSNGAWIEFDAKTSPNRVLQALAAIKPEGATNMYDVFETAFRYRSAGLDTIYVLSDGLPNIGPGLTQEQLANLKETERSDLLAKHIRSLLRTDWNRPLPSPPRVRINTIGFFFESPDVGAFLWALARENDGSFVGMSKP
jgi:hypothetical protein